MQARIFLSSEFCGNSVLLSLIYRNHQALDTCIALSNSGWLRANPQTTPGTSSMKRSEQRILTTHVGSLIRPKTLLDAGKDAAHGPAYQQELKRDVADVVAKQAQAGIDVVNDGEYGKSGWANYILERMTGFEPRPDKLYPAVWLGRDRIRLQNSWRRSFPAAPSARPDTRAWNRSNTRATPRCA